MMFKLFIVDDEPFIAKSIQAIIEASSKQFEVAGLAFGGEAALQQVEEIRPDVVLTDIKMPKMDGITLTKQIKERIPSCLVVIISGYGEFEYAQSALKHGVADYLLKPVSVEQMSRLLNKLAQRLLEESKAKEHAVLQRLLKRGEPFAQASFIPTTMLFRSYAFMVLCIGNYFRTTFSNPYPIYKPQQYAAVDEVLIPYGRQENLWVMEGMNPNERIIIKGMPQRSLDYEMVFRQVFDKLLTVYKTVSAVYHCFDGDIQQLGEQIGSARIALTRHMIFGQSMFKACNELNKNEKRNTVILPDDLKELSLLVRSNAQKQIKSKLFELCKRLQSARVQQTVLERQLRLIIGVIYKELKFEDNSDEIEAMVVLSIHQCDCYNDLFERFYSNLTKLLEQMKYLNPKYKDQKELIDKVEEYILNHYTEQINLQTIANNFGLVPPYLSKLFKEYKRVSPSDFILALKIDSVKKLLMASPTTSLKIIAEETGFSDQFYMSKVFKMITGETPKEYRMSRKSDL